MDTPSNVCDEVTSLLTCQHVTICRSHHDRVEHALLRDTKVRLSISTRDSRTAPCYDMTARAHLRGITIGRRLIRLTQTNPSSISTFIVMFSNDPVTFILTCVSFHIYLSEILLIAQCLSNNGSSLPPSHPNQHSMTLQRRIITDSSASHYRVHIFFHSSLTLNLNSLLPSLMRDTLIRAFKIYSSAPTSNSRRHTLLQSSITCYLSIPLILNN